MGLGKQSSDYWCGWCLLYWSSISYNGHGITVTVITFYLLSFVFFWKHPGALGSHVRFWTPTLTGLNTNEAVRVVSKRAILRYSHHHAHKHTHHDAHLSTRGNTVPRANPALSCARTRAAGAPAGSLTNARSSFGVYFVVANFSQHISFPILGVAKFWGQFKHANLHLLSILLGATDTVTGPFVSD